MFLVFDLALAIFVSFRRVIEGQPSTWRTSSSKATDIDGPRELFTSDRCSVTLTKMLGVSLAPGLSPEWLYPRIVWGGIWGLAFILPFMKSSLINKGLILSLLPTLYMLFMVFPHSHQGMLGLGLGTLTPVFVVFFNMVWGFVAGLILKVSK